MSDVAMELLSVTLTRAPLGLKLDAYGFLAAVLDTAEDATRRALRPCDELIGINGTLYDDIPTESTPDAAAELCDLVGEYVEAGAFPLTLMFRCDPSLMCQPVGACFERRSVAPPRRSSSVARRAAAGGHAAEVGPSLNNGVELGVIATSGGHDGLPIAIGRLIAAADPWADPPPHSAHSGNA